MRIVGRMWLSIGSLLPRSWPTVKAATRISPWAEVEYPDSTCSVSW
jgi:hypothetical protein